jgi:hypothetical protein
LEGHDAGEKWTGRLYGRVAYEPRYSFWDNIKYYTYPSCLFSFHCSSQLSQLTPFSASQHFISKAAQPFKVIAAENAYSDPIKAKMIDPATTDLVMPT